MHITFILCNGLSAVTARNWLENQFAEATWVIISNFLHVWQVSDEHTQTHVEDVIFELFPIEWPITNVFVSDRNGNEL